MFIWMRRILRLYLDRKGRFRQNKKMHPRKCYALSNKSILVKIGPRVAEWIWGFTQYLCNYGAQKKMSDTNRKSPRRTTRQGHEKIFWCHSRTPLSRYCWNDRLTNRPVVSIPTAYCLVCHGTVVGAGLTVKCNHFHLNQDNRVWRKIKILSAASGRQQPFVLNCVCNCGFHILMLTNSRGYGVTALG